MTLQILAPRETCPTTPNHPLGPRIDLDLPWFVLQVSGGRERMAEDRINELMRDVRAFTAARSASHRVTSPYW